MSQQNSIKAHISLNVSDIARSVTFYEAFFGVPAHKRRPGYANFDLSEPPLKFALQEQPMQPGAGPLSHLGFQVATVEQVQAARDRLIAAGLATFDERDATCCYALQDKVWAHDPDGNAWEVYVLLDDMLDEDEPDDHAQMPMAPPHARLSQTIALTPGKPSKRCCS
jgi:catechol 2,3-dioxygenase-like lactoylglutathione lyase family enzyme